MVMDAVKPLTADEIAALCTRHTLFDNRTYGHHGRRDRFTS